MPVKVRVCGPSGEQNTVKLPCRVIAHVGATPPDLPDLPIH